MTLLENLKQLFGLGAAPPDQTPPAGPAPAPATSTTKLPRAPQKREAIYRFIVEKLTPYANEKEGAPIGLHLWVLCHSAEEEELARVALYANQPGQFQSELDRHLANQYIRMPANWPFEAQIVRDKLPADSTYRQGDLALTVLHRSAPTPVSKGLALMRVRALIGQLAEESYRLDPASKPEYCVGRGRTVQTASGRVRTNDIIFLDANDPAFDPQAGDANLAVSRQHATIRYDAAHRAFRLFADPGGLPANGNKIKILRANGTIERADMPGMGYTLAAGDQIELGGEAKLLVEPGE